MSTAQISCSKCGQPVKLIRVSMYLTDRDVQNANTIRRRHQMRSNGQVVAYSVALASLLAEEIQKGSKIFVNYPNRGYMQELVINEPSFWRRN